tara:strand:+ start:1682 stop:1873 length:192 start_codon:yes stop_codon:yes gene_type:complete
MVKTYNNIDKESLLETIEHECNYINSIDTSTEDAKDKVRRRAEELEMIVCENWSANVMRWIYD